MRPSGRLWVAAILAVLTFSPPGFPAARGAEAPPSSLTIAFTGDVIGYLEPCG